MKAGICRCAFGLFLFAIFASSATAAPAGDTSQRSKEVTLAFYKLALQEFRPADAFARYAAPDFVEHSADSAGGTAQSTVKFLTDLIRRSPKPRWHIVRVIAEHDMVFLHVRFTPADDATPVVIGEIFRVRDGKLAEHWDISQHAPAHPMNPNPIL